MKKPCPEITVCICTFKRPDALRRLLVAVSKQVTHDLFSFNIVVVDNDQNRSAEAVCDRFRSLSTVPLDYHVEPEQNIALARNKAVANARGEYVALIDDDELPGGDWLLNLFEACSKFEVDGVLGPVLPAYERDTPAWVVKGGFYERPLHETGTILDWQETRTGNALVRKAVFAEMPEPFKSSFGMGGEDRDFFRRVIARGCRFAWSAEAPVYEAVPLTRCTRSFMLRRALLRGTIPHFRYTDLMKSIMAIPFYTALLPVVMWTGQHNFMKYLIKNCDHIGRVLAFCGITVIKQKYVVE
jgi:succinoglycan biosynthesis protein ExoM